LEGARPLPLLSPSLVPEGHTITWTSVGNVRTLRPNKNLSFRPGAIIDGVPQPFEVGAGAIHINFAQNLLLSIVNQRVYHIAIHSGSDSNV
jgi:hypothetical protein